MTPRIHFGFIICTYLPGIPLAWAIYHNIITWLFKDVTDPHFTELKSTLVTIYVAVSPLIFGLIIDAFRHSLEHFLGWLADKREGIWLKMKKHCVFWSHWDHLPYDKLKVDYHEGFIGHIINIYAVQYHMYEFFDNFALSIFLGILVYFVGKETKIDFLYMAIFLGICIILFALGWLMSKQNNSLIYEYFFRKEDQKQKDEPEA